MENKEIETFYPTSRQDWRQWLQENHQSKPSIWLVAYKKKSKIPSISWSDAVDEALCFGWIDSTRKPIDAEKFMQFFGKRKAKSTWSKVNKAKIVQLIDAGLMTDAGYKSIEIAQQNGSWTVLDEVEELIIPQDLETTFEAQFGSKEHFLSLSKSVQKSLLHRLLFAKRAETRQKRIAEIIALFVQKT